MNRLIVLLAVLASACGSNTLTAPSPAKPAAAVQAPAAAPVQQATAPFSCPTSIEANMQYLEIRPCAEATDVKVDLRQRDAWEEIPAGARYRRTGQFWKVEAYYEASFRVRVLARGQTFEFFKAIGPPNACGGCTGQPAPPVAPLPPGEPIPPTDPPTEPPPPPVATCSLAAVSVAWSFPGEDAQVLVSIKASYVGVVAGVVFRSLGAPTASGPWEQVHVLPEPGQPPIVISSEPSALTIHRTHGLHPFERQVLYCADGSVLDERTGAL